MLGLGITAEVVFCCIPLSAVAWWTGQTDEGWQIATPLAIGYLVLSGVIFRPRIIINLYHDRSNKSGAIGKAVKNDASRKQPLDRKTSRQSSEKPGKTSFGTMSSNCSQLTCIGEGGMSGESSPRCPTSALIVPRSQGCGFANCKPVPWTSQPR